jgi:plastocyanin
MKKLLAMFALAMTAVALVACGGGDGSNETTLKLTADPSGAPKFDKSSLTADAGKITIDFTNPSATPAVVAVKDQAGKVFGKTNDGKYLTHGTATTAAMDLDAGTYIYYSTYDEYESKGMKGILTVK